MVEVENKKTTEKKKKIIWFIIFLLIAIGSITTIIASNKCFSYKTFLEFLRNISPLFIIFAVMAVLGYIFFEGLAITSICKALGYKNKKNKGFIYASADIYFSAITPSASGGQPASAYFMLKDGIKMPVITVALLYNLLMYSISLILIAIFTLFINPTIIFNFNNLSKCLIVAGLFFQICLIMMYYLLLYRDKLLNKIINFFLKLLDKFHLITKREEKEEKINSMMEKYQECAKMIKEKKKVLGKVLFFNICQRICQIAVIVLVFIATNGEIKNTFCIWGLEILVIIGAYCAPIPGAMGITDYLMLDAFKNMMSTEKAINLELLSRAISFYGCLLICGIACLIKYIVVKRKKI